MLFCFEQNKVKFQQVNRFWYYLELFGEGGLATNKIWINSLTHLYLLRSKTTETPDLLTG